MTKTILGIDIAKFKFDCCFLLPDGRKISCSFSNDTRGFALLQTRIKQLTSGPVHTALEATGRYGLALAKFLHAQGYSVSMLNPVCTKNYAKSKLLRNKNDPVDAGLVAQFIKETNPAFWIPPVRSQSELQELTRRLLGRKRELTKERNRLKSPGESKIVLKDIKKSIAALEKSIQTLEKAVADLIKSDLELSSNRELLCSIPGVGPTTAAIILADPGEAVQIVLPGCGLCGIESPAIFFRQFYSRENQAVQDGQPLSATGLLFSRNRWTHS